MCKTVTQEVNENRHDIIEFKSHLGLLADTYHELPQFDDPFPEWGTVDEAVVTTTHAPLPHPCRRTCPPTRSCRSPPGGQEIFDEDEETEEEEPCDYREHPDSDTDEAPKMMMSRRLYHCFSFPFWHLMTKGE
jgi:hypothetical protein